MQITVLVCRDVPIRLQKRLVQMVLHSYRTLHVQSMYDCVPGCKYQLVVVGGGEVGVSVGNQEQLAVGVDGEETQEVFLSASNKVSYGLGLGLRDGASPWVDVGAAVGRHSDGCERGGTHRREPESELVSTPILPAETN